MWLNTETKYHKDWTRPDFEKIAEPGMTVGFYDIYNFSWRTMIFIGFVECEYQGKSSHHRRACKNCKGQICLKDNTFEIIKCMTQWPKLSIRWNKKVLPDELFEI